MGYVETRADDDISADQFDKRHADWVQGIHRALSLPSQRLYGRAAKLIAIYIKSMVVVGPHGGSQLANEAHPPIDRRLLSTIAKNKDVDTEVRKRFRVATWTKFTHADYLTTINDLRGLRSPGEPFWKIEADWTPRDV